ncbi:peptide deformylase [Bacillus thermotolerans]|uniref:Peptide deformylase n=1 Tax=Bacillus thermotolerans TaxID=1221996 RepID=A0A0F5IA34_BACTR|nr:peptide deformylase [Bacillus thermotolerans]KKB42308.1 Peptide deformylase [Bacillus thermotolerans]KKB43956.1 Peptide deformylase [Bacillus thermotolerans]
MAQLPIVKYPDPILEKKCGPVTQFDKKLKKLVNNMYETMVEADGVGLAAPQIGKDLQLAIVDIEDEHGLIVLVNPVIEEAKGSETDVEGCLSFPGIYGHVTRPSYVKVKAQDVKGRFFTLQAKGYLARAIQHEIDHLNGVLFTSKVEKYVNEEELETEELS